MFNTIFFDVNSEGKTFSESNSLFEIARWTFASFRVRYLGSPRPLIKTIFDLKEWKTTFSVWSREGTFSEGISVSSLARRTFYRISLLKMLKLFHQSFNRVQRSEIIFFDQSLRHDNFEVFLFSALPNLLVFKSNIWTRSNINIKLEVEDGKGITSFLTWSCVVNHLLRKWFCFQHCSNVYLFSHLVLGPKQTFHLKNGSQRLQCIVFDFTKTRLCQKSDFFIKYFRLRHCSKKILFSNRVFDFAQFFTYV